MTNQPIYKKAFIALEQLGRRATERDLTKKYIELYPDYAKNYKPTKSTSVQKIRGTINAELSRNALHKQIRMDRSISPFEYYIIDMPKHVVIQPIGSHSTIKAFFNENQTCWAENIKYEEEWKQSQNAKVLFIKNKKVIAIATISKIKKSKDPHYPLEYYYSDLLRTDYFDFSKILELSEEKNIHFWNYKLLDSKKSEAILNYINTHMLSYVNDNEADDELNSWFDDIKSSEPEKTPQPAKSPKTINGQKVFPRNYSYAKKALENTNFSCEIDHSHKTFISNVTNKNFVEAHHLIPMSRQTEFDYSLDIPANIVALCPNCHRKIHLGNVDDKKIMIDKLLAKRQKDLKHYGIEISANDLKDIYL